MKKISTWLLEKPQHAPAAALLLALLPLVGITVVSTMLVSIIVGFVTLVQGEKAGLKVLLWVMIPSVALLWLRSIGIVDYVLLQSVFVWAGCGLYLRFCSWTLVVESLTVVAMVVVLLAHWFVPDLHAAWMQFFVSRFDEMKKIGEPLPADMAKQFLSVVSPIATGVMAFVSMLLVMISLIYSNRVKSRLTSADSSQGFLNIRLGVVSIALAIVVFSLAFMHVAAAIDLQRVVIFPFLISGLSVLHYCCHGHRFAAVVLVLLYASFIFLGITIYLVSMIGLMDIGFNFRKRFVRPI